MRGKAPILVLLFVAGSAAYQFGPMKAAVVVAAIAAIAFRVWLWRREVERERAILRQRLNEIGESDR